MAGGWGFRRCGKILRACTSQPCNLTVPDSSSRLWMIGRHDERTPDEGSFRIQTRALGPYVPGVEWTDVNGTLVSMGPKGTGAPASLPDVFCELDDANRTLELLRGARSQPPPKALGPREYEFKIVRVDDGRRGGQRSPPTSASVALACNASGMQPVCNDFSTCGADPSAIFLGQGGRLSDSAFMTPACPASHPFPSRLLYEKPTCFNSARSAYIGIHHELSCGEWCSFGSMVGGRMAGCEWHQDWPFDCGPQEPSGVNADLRAGFLPFILALNPGGMCYYSGLDNGRSAELSKASPARGGLMCSNSSCSSSFRRRPPTGSVRPHIQPHIQPSLASEAHCVAFTVQLTPCPAVGGPAHLRLRDGRAGRQPGGGALPRPDRQERAALDGPHVAGHRPPTSGSHRRLAASGDRRGNTAPRGVVTKLEFPLRSRAATTATSVDQCVVRLGRGHSIGLHAKHISDNQQESCFCDHEGRVLCRVL